MPCDPLRDLRAWQERLERLAAQHATAWAPPIDVYETDDRYVITAEVPGISREQVDLAVQDNRLTHPRHRGPAASPESATRHYHQVERGHGSFLRTFEFADAVDEEGITADLRDGVLTVTLPKIGDPPRTIEIYDSTPPHPVRVRDLRLRRRHGADRPVAHAPKRRAPRRRPPDRQRRPAPADRRAARSRRASPPGRFRAS